MTILASQIVADVREKSSLFNNNLFSDAQIVGLFNDGASELYDWMVAQFEAWFLTSVDFSLAGGIGANVFPMPMDKLLKDNTLEMNPTNNTPIPIPRLGSWSDRNRIGWTAGGCSLDGGRRYYPAGSNLMVFPPQNSAGSYRLWYTPKYIPVGLPVAGVPLRSFNVASSDAPVQTGPAVFGFNFANGGFTSADVGAVVTPAFTNASGIPWNTPFTVSIVNSGTQITVVEPMPATAGFTGPATGTVAVTNQPVGTVPSFNVVMEPWVLYPEVHASIAIRTSRQQDTSDLQPKLAGLKQRIASATANRTEEVPQSPLRDGQRIGNSYFGAG